MKSFVSVFASLFSVAAFAQSGNFGIGTATPGSKLTVNGSLGLAYNSITATTYTMAATDYYVVWNGTAAGIMTLPAAVGGAGNFKGRLYAIKNTSSSFTVAVAANGAELIDQSGGTGLASISLESGQSLTLISTGNTTGIVWELVSMASTMPATSSWTVSGNDQYSALPGNVGVGTASPSSKLTVSGNIEIPAASSFKYSTPKAKSYSISGTAFGVEGVYQRTLSEGGVYVAGPVNEGNFITLYAGVNLPDGAIVTKLDAYVGDDDADANFADIELYKNDGVNPSESYNALMATTGGTSGGSALIQKLTTDNIILPTIDNTNYCYFLKVGTFMSSHLTLYGVTISYTISALE